MVPVRTASLIVATWVREQLVKTKARLRISCRSAVWPGEVQTAIRESYSADQTAIAYLKPLSDEDIRTVAANSGIVADAFLRAVADTRVLTLAQHPLTLEMLVHVFGSEGRLPQSRRDLFHNGVGLLLRERKERREAGTAPDIPLVEMIDAAERIACYTLLSGREVVDLSDAPTPDSLDWAELSSLRSGTTALDDKLLRSLASCALCEGDGPDRFRFAHRQFAEYLAGRRIAELLPHQAMSLLASGLGWRAGVAGPLRETAAFAAMENGALAKWLAERDPEVIGLSDVADDSLRRQSMLTLLERFRRHELTDVQASRDELRLAGFQYASADKDLSPVLRERGDGVEDVLECAVELIESWQLQAMSNDLADLALDSAAPMHPRKSAGYALARFGTREARRRLRPLLQHSEHDPEYDLKGLALRCLWPADLTVPELLEALTPRRHNAHYGAYDSFFYELERSGFNAEGFLIEGLRWARQHIRRDGDHDPGVRIAKRIAHRAIEALPDPTIADGLATLLIDCGKVYADSPLNPIADNGVFRHENKQPETSPLAGRIDARREIVDALVAKEPDQSALWWVTHHTRGLLTVDDFPWLMQRAVDVSQPMTQRQRYAELTRMLPWYDHQPSIEALLMVRDVEPVASLYGFPLSMELDSEAAANARKQHAEMKRMIKPARRKRVKPPPAERVRQALELSETKDPRFFLNLCGELTLEEYSAHYGFARYLTETPGWATADEPTRTRIVDAGKRLLTAPTDEPERARTSPLNSILPGYMPAIMLIAQLEPAWLSSQPEEWWTRWAWYILRELHLHMHGERNDAKTLLVAELHRRAPEALRNAVTDLATMAGQESRPMLDATLEVLSDVFDPELDCRLRKLIEAGSLGMDRLEAVAEFVLARDSGTGVPACLAKLDEGAVSASEETAVHVALSLLSQRTAESWDPVIAFLRRRRNLAARILADFAHNERRAFRRDGAQSWLTTLTVPRVAQLLELLIELFPYESDPKHDTIEMRQVLPEDSARELRGQLMNWLINQSNAEAILALRHLEQKWGTRYPRLRRPRAIAERAYRLSRWGPIPPGSVAALLHAKSKVLIRSGSDAIDGIGMALEQFATAIRRERSDELEDFWNLPRKGAPTPKTEERVSAKLCQCIRDYFANYAVTADREVQVYRRKTAQNDDGAPGSEVDVLMRVPAAGAVAGDAIAVPIEVKLSGNPERRTALESQLSARYMTELATSFGMFVVAWMKAPRLPATYKPIWDDIESAKAELEQQAEQVAAKVRGNIGVVVFDASIPVKPRTRMNKARTKRKPKPASSKRRVHSTKGKPPPPNQPRLRTPNRRKS